jgi:glutaredoxin
MKNTNYLHAIILNNCPYSIALDELLNNYNISFKKIVINQNNKYKYKTKLIDTFPQLYLMYNNKKYLIGGYSISKEIIENIKNSDNLDIIKNNIQNLLPHFNNKQILRLTQLIIN